METVEKNRGADPELEEYLAGLCTEGSLENPDAVSLEIQTWVTNSLGGLCEGIGSETTLDGPWIETELPVRYDPVQGTISAEGKTEELRGRLDRMASLFRALTDHLILTYPPNPPESEGRGGPTPAASFMHEPVNLDETELQCALAEDRFLGFRVFDFDAVSDFGHADPHSFPVLTRRQKVGGKLAEQFTVDLKIQGLSVRVIPSVSVSPLILFRDDPEDLAGRGFYFVSVGLALQPPRLEDATDHEIDLYAELSDLTTWPAEDLKRLWEALLRTKFASATVVFGITTSEPEATLRDVTQAEPLLRPSERQVPGPVRQHLMNPVPIPRKAAKDADALALTRGLGRIFTKYGTHPDLSLREKTALAEADSLFWPHLEDYLDQTQRDNWTLQDKEKEPGHVLTLEGVSTERARAWWADFKQTLNASNDGPGLEVAEPQFETANRFQGGDVVTATQIELWPQGAGTVSVSFRRVSSPGYMALLDRHSPRPFFAEGWYWMPRGDRREGFRIGGLSALLFPEGRDALKRIQRREAEEYERRLQEIFRQPSLFRDEDSRVMRDLEGAIKRAKQWVSQLTVYDTKDLMLCVYEAFYRQRNAWVTETLELPGKQPIPITPYRYICLEPQNLRVRLDPANRWGRNWRSKLFDRLEALTTFEHQTLDRKGRRIDIGDRFLRRVIDGQQGTITDGSVPDTDSGLGLTRILRNAGALPIDAFFVEVSIDFMERLCAWAVDEKGAVKWGLEAARLNEQKALGNGEPKAKAKVEVDAVRQRVRDNPTYEHSPRLLTLSNLEEWPAARKELAACLLQEATPNYEKSDGRRRLKPNHLGGNRKLVRLNEQDYIACNGNRNRGYRLETWMQKANYELRKGPGGGLQAFGDYLADLEALMGEAIGLWIEIQGHPQDHPLRVLQSYRDNRKVASRLLVKKYLPADLEIRLKEQLEAAGIFEGEHQANSVVTPSRPGGLTPADIRMGRKAAGWTQAELAAKVGISHKQVSLWERAKDPIPAEQEKKLQIVLREFL